nr:hypothetical protein [Propionicimonas sp.]
MGALVVAEFVERGRSGVFLGPDQIRAELNEPFASITRPGDD